jgi:hypothetical protein
MKIGFAKKIRQEPRRFSKFARRPSAVCVEILIRVDDVVESLKLAE